MEILPILRTLHHNRIGPLLIGLQIALTLAIVCNSLSVIREYIQHIRTPSGIDEANILVVGNSWVGASSDLRGYVMADLAVLRSLPGVVGVEATDGFPLGGSGWNTGVSLKPDQRDPTVHTAEYFVDEHGLATYGLTLASGRWFLAGEVGDLRVDSTSSPNYSPAAVVVTRSLAATLFPNGSALGQIIYLNPAAPTRIIGIVERAQAPWAGVDWSQSSIENSVFLPYRFLAYRLSYVIRTRPGELAAVLRAAPGALYGVMRRRTISSISPFDQVRRHAYQAERSFSAMLGILCSLLMAVTACGIVGLTQYWVAQRRRQIGMRRALGARRFDILCYFHTENLLIVGGGVVVGIAAGLAGNLWLASTLSLARMGVAWVIAGAAIVIAISQAAVLWPALRAASIPPAVATRSL